MTERGEEIGGGGEGEMKERESERESMLSFGIWIHEKKKRKKLVLDPTLEKEGFQFPTSQGMSGKTGLSREKNISWMQCKPYDINLDEGFIAIKVQENKQTFIYF